MDQKQLKEFAGLGFSIMKISKITGKSYSSVRYWMKKYDIIKNRQAKNGKICICCGAPLIATQQKYCSIRCHNTVANPHFQTYQLQKKRGLQRKRELIKMHGGKCSICGYNKNYAALEFHHIDPTTKSGKLDIRKLSNSKWEWCVREANKCMLVCSNCHSEIHHPSLSM